MALPHPDVNAVLRFPAKLGTSHKKAPQNLFKTPFAPSNFPPRPQARPSKASLCEGGARSAGGRDGRGRAPPLRTSIESHASYVRADVGIRPYEITGGVCVIRTGGQSPRAPTTVYRQQKYFPKQRPLAATYLCRFAAKARFDNRPNPRRVFPKREGRSPPSLVVSRG